MGCGRFQHLSARLPSSSPEHRQLDDAFFLKGCCRTAPRPRVALVLLMLRGSTCGKTAMVRHGAPPAGRRASFLGSSGRGQSRLTDKKNITQVLAKTCFGRVLSMCRYARVLWVPLQCPYNALTVPLQCPYENYQSALIFHASGTEAMKQLSSHHWDIRALW